MKHLSKNVGVILGILLLGGLVFWLTQTLTSPPGDAPSPFTLQSPIIFQSPVLTPIPSPTATPISIVNNASSPISPPDAPPPPCQFEAEPGTVLPESESLLERYVFSEPRPVLDYIAGLEIIQWFPGDQRLLISRTGNGRQIEIFNIQSEKIKEYASGGIGGLGTVSWLEQGQAIVYTEFGETGIYSLNLANSQGITKSISEDLASPFIATQPNGQASFVSSSQPGKPQLFNPATEKAKGIPFKEFKLPETKGPTYPFKTYKMTWHPDEKRLAYYNEHAFYILDSQTGNVCELELGSHKGLKQWALSAHWSPDGQYLALLNTVGELPVPFIDLSIIDMATGERKVLNIDGSGNKYALTWAPNSRDMLVMTAKPTYERGNNVYIVSVVSAKTRQILQNSSFLFSGSGGVAWSSNGEIIAISCLGPDMNDPRYLCLMNVEVE